jgi:hypothetical protein
MPLAPKKFAKMEIECRWPSRLRLFWMRNQNDSLGEGRNMTTPFQPRHHGQLEHIDDDINGLHAKAYNTMELTRPCAVDGLPTDPDRSQLPQPGSRSVGRGTSRETISLNAQGLHVLFHKTARRGIHEMAFVCRHPNVSGGGRKIRRVRRRRRHP